jgi:MFS family permease
VVAPDRLAVEHDLYVLKSHTELSLSLAGVLDAQGANLLNPYRSCVATQDKIVAARRLRAAGVPTPRTWVTGDFELLSRAAEQGSLIVKPHRGHRGVGATVVTGPDELAALPASDTPMVVQEYIRGSGEDLKVYVVDGEVFAVHKPFFELSFTVPGRPAAVTDRVREIALDTGRILGLGLYGLDIIESEDGPVVVDVNYFPGYKGVPKAAALIANYIEEYARGHFKLELPTVEEQPRLTTRVSSPVATVLRGVRARAGTINPSLVAIVAEGFLSRLSFGFITFALPLYAFREFGLGLTEVGLLLSLSLIVAVGLKPFAGQIADRIGMRPAFIAAIGLRTLVPLYLAVAAAPWQLFAVRAAHGVSMALRDPAAGVLISEHGGKENVASAFAWYQTAKTVAGALGKAGAGVLLTLTAANFGLIFVVAFVLSALPLLIAARFIHEPAPDEPEAVSPQEGPARASTERGAPPVLRFMGLGFLISGTAYMLTNLFPILATEYAGLSDAQAGLVYIVAVLAALSGPIFGWLSDKVSRRLVLSVRGAANVLSSLVYLVAPNFIGLMVGRAVDDLGKAAFRPAWGALMAHVASLDRQRRGRTFGSLGAGEDAGEIVGPVLAGFLWSTWGVPALLGTRVGGAVGTEIYAIALVHSLERQRATGARKPRARTARRRQRSGHPA